MSELKKQIYKAQCIGNVEPIEYMVPYPNLRALIDGQNIKYGEKMVYAAFLSTSTTTHADKTINVSTTVPASGAITFSNFYGGENG